MKKTILVLSTILSATAAMSQTYVTAGVNASTISIDKNGNTDDSKTLASFNVGLLQQFNLSKVVDLEVGALLTGKGAKAETNFNSTDYVRAKFNPLYVEVPVNLLFKVTDKSNNGFSFHAGPYIAAGVGGKSTIDTKIGALEINKTSNIKFNNDNVTTTQQEDAGYNKLKRFDYGLNAGVGFTTKSVLLRLNYGLGLAKINSTQNNNSADDKNKYRVLSLNVAFNLN